MDSRHISAIELKWRRIQCLSLLKNFTWPNCFLIKMVSKVNRYTQELRVSFVKHCAFSISARGKRYKESMQSPHSHGSDLYDKYPVRIGVREFS